MFRRIRVSAGALVVLAAALVLAAPAPAAVSVRGTVVHRNARTHSFVVASATGRLTKVRSHHAARVGRAVRVAGRTMRDGSIAATRVLAGARHRTARLRGTVTFANRRSHRFTVSSAAGSISVRSGSAAADATVPPVGQQVVVTITVQPGGVLEEDGVDEQGMDQEVEIEGVVMAIDPAAHTVSVSSSDDDTTGGVVTVGFPATFDLSGVAVGNEIEIKAIRQADGTFVLSKLETGNENDLENQADNGDQGDGNSGDQGAGNGDQGAGNGDQGGGGGND
ncbi:MAG: hypothetical protein QOH72_5043 [Solirubrobacteraceae bacterium]|jgi:hypothetical protein|nr:hypothetical protein [Solirubrobacteraceae bacterium]